MPPAEGISEWWCLAGRRGGKSLISALCGAYLALFHDYRRFLAPGERATVMLLASDVKQAPLVNLFSFCRDLFLGISFIESKKRRAIGSALISNHKPGTGRGLRLTATVTGSVQE